MGNPHGRPITARNLIIDRNLAELIEAWIDARAFANACARRHRRPDRRRGP